MMIMIMTITVMITVMITAIIMVMPKNEDDFVNNNTWHVCDADKRSS